LNATTQAHPHFFTGNYAPLTEEHDIAALDIEGTMPPGLSGSLYRVGPSPQYAPRDGHYHWFSGDGMVHAFHIEGGRVSYSNRWARTPKWQLEHEAGRALFGTFGNPATSDPLAQGRNGGTANTSMLWHGNRLFALEESHQPFELDARTLASKGHQSFGDRIASRCTAHPKVDPESGELHFFAYSPDGPGSPTMLYGTMDRDCEVTGLQSFTAPYASMAHDFMVTRGHVLFPVMPLTLSVERAMRGKPLLAWDAQLRTHVGVMRRGSSTDTLRWFEAEACHVFHVMNAWDDGDTLVAYVMQSETAPGLPDAEGRPGDPGAMAARLCRWTFDLSSAGNTISPRVPRRPGGGVSAHRRAPRGTPQPLRLLHLPCDIACAGRRRERALRQPGAFRFRHGRAPHAHAAAGRCGVGAGVRAAPCRCGGGRRLAARGGMARAGAAQRPAGDRRGRCGRGARGDRAAAASRAVRLSWQLARQRLKRERETVRGARPCRGCRPSTTQNGAP
jgi:carotenoid cleavage dioxygenase-like enzyme